MSLSYTPSRPNQMFAKDRKASSFKVILVIVAAVGGWFLYKKWKKSLSSTSLAAETAMQGKVWDSGRTHSDIFIKDNQLTIKRELHTGGWALATINYPLTGSSNLTFSLRVDSVSNIWMYIGVRHPGDSLDWHPNSSQISNRTSYCSDGVIYINEKKVTSYAKQYTAGDLLKVEVTMSDGSIKFFCNDVLQGEGKGIQQGMVPFMSLSDTGDQATLLSISS